MGNDSDSLENTMARYNKSINRTNTQPEKIKNGGNPVENEYYCCNGPMLNPPSNNQRPNNNINPYDMHLNENPNGQIKNNPQNINNNQNLNAQLENLFRRAETYKPKKKYNITSKRLIEIFKKHTVEGTYLNQYRFDDAIEEIFPFPIPEMHFTYLSKQIYVIFDDSNDGRIQQNEFYKGFATVLKDQDYRIKLSMMAMMSTPDMNRDFIKLEEIQEFFYKSFIYGFRHLGYQCKNRYAAELQNSKITVPTPKSLGSWAEKSENKIKEFIENDLRKFGIDPKSNISLMDFRRWIYNDHNLYLSYAGKNVVIATSLIKLDDVGLEEEF